ncbi:hypothetical protein E3P99_01405 [Wallemia hederae]|uniref:Palmitoyltransferase n=1 Tax=Wallemia hederae TaxID=1540922 RepID=A0A4T0FQE8_9BASI|nr:hypothetical protein E3P99_01405 [Wallemia hederae]
MEKYARSIHKTLRRCEDMTDRWIGLSGPIFIAFAVALLIPCTYAFFEVIFAERFSSSSLGVRCIAGLYCTWHAVLIFFHYYKAVTVSPGWTDSVSTRTSTTTTTHTTTNDIKTCHKCIPPLPKPERAHHCRACNRCVLKYDHHCPWINQCVGIGNERYFVLFMIYLSTACCIVSLMGYSVVFHVVLPLRGSEEWSARYYSPAFLVMLTWMLALFIGAVVGVMGVWQLSLAVKGLTSVEFEDRRAFLKAERAERKAARRSGRPYSTIPTTLFNPYDFGWRENTLLFFNIGQGRRHPLTLLLPIPHPPAGDGISYAKKSPQGGLQLSFDSDSECEEGV